MTGFHPTTVECLLVITKCTQKKVLTLHPQFFSMSLGSIRVPLLCHSLNQYSPSDSKHTQTDKE